MKIVVNNITSTIKFGNLPIGHVFHDHEEYWYLKCESVMCEDYAEPINAVNLETGEFEHFALDDDIFPVVGKFVAEIIGVST